MFALRGVRLLRLRTFENGCEAISRCFTTGKSLFTKIYAENENFHFSKIMKGMPDRYAFAVDWRTAPGSVSEREFKSTMAQNWETLDAKSTARAFTLVSDYAAENSLRISDEKFDAMIDRLTDSLRLLTDDEIKIVCADLKKWPEAESVYERNFVEVWAALDDALIERVKNRRPRDVLVLIDCMHRLNLSRKSDFVYFAIQKLARKQTQLTPHQFVQTMFYVSTSRKKPLDILDLERRFGQYMDSLSVCELGVVCSGFFKSKSNIKENSIVEKLMERVTSEADTLNGVTLNAIVKLINYSLRHRNCSRLPQLLDAFVPQIPKLNLMCCVQLALLPTPICYYHEKLLSAISENFLTDPSRARLKDLERLAFAFSFYNHTSNMKVFDAIIDELRQPHREKEFALHGRCLATCLSYLGIVEKYPFDLVNRVLNEEYIKSAYGYLPNFRGEKSKTAREILVLNWSVEIDCPEYTGSKVKQKNLTILAKYNSDFLPDNSGRYPLNISQRTILDILLTLQKMRGGPEYVYGDHVLPHYQRGGNVLLIVLVICDDAAGNPVKIADNYPSGEFGELRRTPINTSLTWYAVMFLGKHSLIKNTGQNLGLTNMKIRHLKKIGYIPILVSLNDWPHKEEENIIYMNNCMEGNCNSPQKEIAVSKS